MWLSLILALIPLLLKLLGLTKTMEPGSLRPMQRKALGSVRRLTEQLHVEFERCGVATTAEADDPSIFRLAEEGSAGA